MGTRATTALRGTVLKYGKREIAKLAAVLNQDYATAEDAALAALKAMEEIFASRAKFTVVGKLKSTLEDGELNPHDERAVCASLGWFSTEGDAKTAAEGLWRSTSTGETFYTVVVPVYHGTPAEFHKARKKLQDDRKAEIEKRQRERLHKYIELTRGKSIFEPRPRLEDIE